MATSTAERTASLRLPALVRHLVADLATRHGKGDAEYLADLIRREALRELARANEAEAAHGN